MGAQDVPAATPADTSVGTIPPSIFDLTDHRPPLKNGAFSKEPGTHARFSHMGCADSRRRSSRLPPRTGGARLKKPAKTREELESAIRLEMEDICEWPTDLAISVAPHENTWKVVIMTEGPQDADRCDMIETIADRLQPIRLEKLSPMRRLQSELRSSGTSPNLRMTVASPKSPVAGSPLRLKATAPTMPGFRDSASAFITAAFGLKHSTASPAATPSSLARRARRRSR